MEEEMINKYLNATIQQHLEDDEDYFCECGAEVPKDGDLCRSCLWLIDK